jgi:DNA-binding transcriptional LysR family regulator
LCFSPQKTLQRGENSVTVALPGYVCRDDVRSGVLRQVLPGWTADDSRLTALMPYRRGLLPSVRAFIDHLAAELPKAVQL